MNRLALRTLLRRRLQDTGEATWDDTELNDLLNDAYSWIQVAIYGVDQEAHLVQDTADITSGTNFYPYPDTFGVSEVAVKLSSTATDYTILEKRNYRDLKDAGSTNPYYAKRGRFVYISPTPTENVTDGLQITHAVIDQLDDDAQEPIILIPLHMAIVWWAQINASEEDDAADLDKVQAKLDKALANIPFWYGLDADSTQAFIPVRV